ncbi:Lactonase, 7-bladed beta-propeller-domain-containing protein [Thermothelomyces heterothallicus CBS 202.75]|uniref:Lactonase, 7-bladed beta-propeller-domain-containing protein n=1 Tax=Thermothelomyces heterothallicus CBS 202.75 TaxID=1149848 RepID=UPI0037434D35
MSPVTQPLAAAALALAPGALGANLIASHFSGTVYSLSLTSSSNSTGTLSVTSETDGCGATPAWLQLYSDTGKVYCFDESWLGSGSSAEYEIADDGSLTLTGTLQTTGNSVHGALYGGADGKGFVATVEYTPSTLTTYKMPFGGGQRLALEKFTMEGQGPNPRQDVPHPHEAHVDPTGNYMVVPDLGADLLRVFRINAETGELTACSEGQAGPGDGPRHVVFWKNADGLQKAYVVNELGNSVSAWDVEYPEDDDAAAAGCLALNKTQTLSTYEPGTSGGPTTKAAEIRVVGNFLYASNRADETFGPGQDSIATYTIDEQTGELAWLEAANSYSYYPRTFEFNRDGTLVAVGGQTSSNVAIIARDPDTGKLGKLVANLEVGRKGRAGQEDGLSAVVWVQ